ncbi:hypothetical protein [Odoribacter sp. Z80]|uniref:hypothetical protein n=1 Tax=Odoribacter sp. Z80 TaxID=2304575 RepID=UPI00137964E3|nr:hypothetical protein [Odoribacter sp. Z80]
MKRLLFICIGIIIFCGSCRTSKQYSRMPERQSREYQQREWVRQDNAGIQQEPQQKSTPVKKIEEEADECERASWDYSDGRLKAYASAIDEDRDFARQQAAVLARGQLASDIQALITNVMKIYRGTVSKNSVATASRSAKQTVDQITEECLANTTIVCSKRYIVGDKYESVVCVSQVGTIEEAAKKAVLAEDAVLEVEFDEQRFRQSYQEEVERYRQEKRNNR